MNPLKPPEWLLKVLPQFARDFLEAGGWYVVLLFIVVLVLVIAGFIVSKVLGLFKTKHKDEDKPLNENLAEFPPPPKAGPRKLLVQGSNARVRLVVLAPVGKSAKLDATKAEAVLEHVVRGLGAVTGQDKPRIKVWPPQLSHDGFVETFFRVVKSPEQQGKSSKWSFLAGKAKAGDAFVLVGLALLTDETTNLGRMRPLPQEWGNYLKIKG